MTRPRVSVAIPIYNAQDTLAEAVQSIQRQTLDSIEILLFDDGSSDRSGSVADNLAAGDSRIRLIGRERVGLVRALRRLIDASRATAIARMDADDVSHPKRIERQLQMLNSDPRLAVVGCQVRCFPEDRLSAGMRRYESWLNQLVSPGEISRDIYVESPLCHPSVLMRKAAYHAAGGYMDDQTPEDYGLWLRIHALGYKLAKVPEVLLDWRDGPTRLTRTDLRYGVDRFIRLKCEQLVRGPLQSAASSGVVICGAGITGRRWRSALGRYGVHTAAFIDINPARVRAKRHPTPVLGVAALETPKIRAHFLLIAVAKPKARQQIRTHLTRLGYEEIKQFICVA